jgi:NOL1/NOP2/fmu family ribosome biogenesis protein
MEENFFETKLNNIRKPLLNDLKKSRKGVKNGSVSSEGLDESYIGTIA